MNAFPDISIFYSLFICIFLSWRQQEKWKKHNFYSHETVEFVYSVQWRHDTILLHGNDGETTIKEYSIVTSHTFKPFGGKRLVIFKNVSF